MESHWPTCINPCKSGDGSCLKKIELPTQGGVEVGILGVKKSKLREMSWTVQKINKICFFTHPTPGGFRGGGGVGGQNFMSGKFHELSRKSIKKNPPPPTKGVAVGILGGQKIKSPGNGMNCREK